MSKRIVGWAVAERMTAELVTSALTQAVSSGCVTGGTIIPTDQGSQYVSHNFRALLRVHGRRQSMSRRSNCDDNAQAESFFSRYKAELLEGGVFAAVSQARSETFRYIEGYYNRVRRHSALGYKTPAEFARDSNLKKIGRKQREFCVRKHLTISLSLLEQQRNPLSSLNQYAGFILSPRSGTAALPSAPSMNKPRPVRRADCAARRSSGRIQ